MLSSCGGLALWREKPKSCRMCRSTTSTLPWTIPRARQSSYNWTSRNYSISSLDHPHIQRALKREADTDEAKHALYDVMLAEAGLKEEWAEHEIIALIREGNTRIGRPEPADAFCKLIIHEASVREKTGDPDLAREALLNNLSDIWGLNITRRYSSWHGKCASGTFASLTDGKSNLAPARTC